MIFNAIFPANCRVCNEPFLFRKQNHICEDCIYSIEEIKPIYCHSCGKSVKYCVDCVTEKKFDDIGVFTKVNENIKKIIAIYKLNSVKPIAEDLATLISRDIREFVEKHKIDTITYVPLHRKLEKERGFNHLREILIKIFGKKNVKEILKKVRHTELQMNLSAEERKRNLKNAFLLKNIQDVMGKNVLIFDDIMTTGSTLLETLSEIKKGYPNKVFAYVIAR
jgi:ComF family protein